MQAQILRLFRNPLSYTNAVRVRGLAIALISATLMASASAAQFGFGDVIPLARPESFDGSFQFCRIYFRNAMNGDGGGWVVDFPRADQNLSVRLAELTKTPVGMHGPGQPKHLVVRLTDAELFRCPFTMMTEVGGAYLDEDEAKGLRDYLLKGGFLWADDFWGEYAWAFWENQLRKALPSSAFPVVELTLDHPIFHEVLNVRRVPQIPSINFWAGSGGDTAQREDAETPHVRAILDDHGRIMVLMTFNTDFGDAFEREGDNHEYFEAFSVDGYAFGINALIYAMTH